MGYATLNTHSSHATGPLWWTLPTALPWGAFPLLLHCLGEPSLLLHCLGEPSLLLHCLGTPTPAGLAPYSTLPTHRSGIQGNRVCQPRNASGPLIHRESICWRSSTVKSCGCLLVQVPPALFEKVIRSENPWVNF